MADQAEQVATARLRYRGGADAVGTLARFLREQGLTVDYRSPAQTRDGLREELVTIVLAVGSQVTAEALWSGIRVAWARYRDLFPGHHDALEVIEADGDPDDGGFLA